MCECESDWLLLDADPHPTLAMMAIASSGSMRLRQYKQFLILMLLYKYQTVLYF